MPLDRADNTKKMADNRITSHVLYYNNPPTIHPPSEIRNEALGTARLKLIDRAICLTDEERTVIKI